MQLEPTQLLLGLEPGMAAQLKRELLKMPARHFRAHPDVARILGEAYELVSRPPKGVSGSFRQLRLQALLLQYLTLTIASSRQGLRGAATPLMRRVLRYVDDHLNEPVRVARLAQVARLSESRCKARFKREIGVPPAEYWLRKKIERAIARLKVKSVTDVAYELGFSSSQYFATVFKRYTLVNPSQFHVKKNHG
jgi:AraC-like DNA-binding protein